jgi:hypothetical protein
MEYWAMKETHCCIYNVPLRRHPGISMRSTIDNPVRVKSINADNAKYLSVFRPDKPIAKSEYFTVMEMEDQRTLLQLKKQDTVKRLKMNKMQFKDEAGMADILNGKKIILYFVDDIDVLYGSISAFAQ